MELQGKTAIVTGAGSGLGRAIALAMATAGMNVAICGRRVDKLDETINLISEAGGQAIAMPSDVTDATQVAALVAQTLKSFGQIDVLFNNAGSLRAVGGMWEVDAESWWRDIEINVKGSMLCARAVLPHMLDRNSGVIINMSGGGAVGPLPGASAYGTSKAAVLRMTDSLARELERVESAVMVFAMDPGFNPTEMTQQIADLPSAKTWLPFISERLAKGEGRRPEECAQMTLDLLRMARPELNGRVIYTGRNMAEIAAAAEDIQTQDLLSLRLRQWPNTPA